MDVSFLFFGKCSILFSSSGVFYESNSADGAFSIAFPLIQKDRIRTGRLDYPNMLLLIDDRIQSIVYPVAFRCLLAHLSDIYRTI